MQSTLLVLSSFKQTVDSLFGIKDIQFNGGCISDLSDSYFNAFKVAFERLPIATCFVHIIHKFYISYRQKGNGVYSTITKKQISSKLQRTMLMQCASADQKRCFVLSLVFVLIIGNTMVKQSLRSDLKNLTLIVPTVLPSSIAVLAFPVYLLRIIHSNNAISISREADTWMESYDMEVQFQECFLSSSRRWSMYYLLNGVVFIEGMLFLIKQFVLTFVVMRCVVLISKLMSFVVIMGLT